jgi:hypothetical protein
MPKLPPVLSQASLLPPSPLLSRAHSQAYAAVACARAALGDAATARDALASVPAVRGLGPAEQVALAQLEAQSVEAAGLPPTIGEASATSSALRGTGSAEGLLPAALVAT